MASYIRIVSLDQSGASGLLHHLGMYPVFDASQMPAGGHILLITSHHSDFKSTTLLTDGKQTGNYLGASSNNSFN
jgi:hypothetical protein